MRQQTRTHTGDLAAKTGNVGPRFLAPFPGLVSCLAPFPGGLWGPMACRIPVRWPRGRQSAKIVNARARVLANGSQLAA
jgi:hypothetical protein